LLSLILINLIIPIKEASKKRTSYSRPASG
jgi:hypothetical protein